MTKERFDEVMARMLSDLAEVRRELPDTEITKFVDDLELDMLDLDDTVCERMGWAEGSVDG